jgi:tetratricopeptide (TPR) repeat protein
MAMKRYLLPFLLLILTGTWTYGQITRAELLRRMDLGKALMENGDYEEAEKEFVLVLKHMQPLPQEMAYLYGRNSFHLKQYKRSINWLNKYLQLKGARGTNYEKAVMYLKLSEEAYLAERRAQSQQVADALADADFDCGGLEKMLCPVCHGSGVVISKGIFEPIYKTCEVSNGEGFLSCADYNLFMKGLLKPKQPAK